VDHRTVDEPLDVPRRFCPSCGQWTSGRFRQGPGARPDARCPHCKSLERQRFLAVLTSLSPLVEVGTLLDIAPAACTTAVLSELTPKRHIRMDIGYDERGVDLFGSVTAIPLVSGSVDLLVCYHVLEHVPDDLAAMRELARVLAPGGVGLVQVPIRFGMPTDEDLAADEAERVRRFGQHDHVRYYGDDFEQRLVDSGLVFTRTSPRSLVGERVCTVLGLIPDEWVWVVRPHAHADGDSADDGAPLVVPPPTGLARALDAVVEAWVADRGQLSQARRRARRLRTELDSRSWTPAWIRGRPPGRGRRRGRAARHPHAHLSFHWLRRLLARLPRPAARWVP
jgi:SAM-dependent methyltransferase